MMLMPAIDAYARHLSAVRRLSSATVRAYRADLTDLASTCPGADLKSVGLEDLRDWLWTATQRGEARSTIARRAAAARGFFAWAVEEGLVPTDPSLRLQAPKRGRTLPRIANVSA
ncbi:MAG: recombinase XerC, partial [Microbacterium sp.]